MGATVTEPVIFDPGFHVYSVGGIVKPSVNQILQAVGIGTYGEEISEEVLEAAAERGTLVHRLCQLYDEGDLDESTVDPELDPWLEGYQQWLDQSGFVAIGVEEPFYCESDDFCGTADRTGYTGDQPTVVDIKTCAKRASHGVAMAAYGHAHFPGKLVRRVVVMLVPEQKRKKYREYVLPESDYFWDVDVFLAARKIAAWKELNCA